LFWQYFEFSPPISIVWSFLFEFLITFVLTQNSADFLIISIDLIRLWGYSCDIHIFVIFCWYLICWPLLCGCSAEFFLNIIATLLWVLYSNHYIFIIFHLKFRLPFCFVTLSCWFSLNLWFGTTMKYVVCLLQCIFLSFVSSWSAFALTPLYFYFFLNLCVLQLSEWGRCWYSGGVVRFGSLSMDVRHLIHFPLRVTWFSNSSETPQLPCWCCTASQWFSTSSQKHQSSGAAPHQHEGFWEWRCYEGADQLTVRCGWYCDVDIFDFVFKFSAFSMPWFRWFFV